jgi:hypothetical protein
VHDQPTMEIEMDDVPLSEGVLASSQPRFQRVKNFMLTGLVYAGRDHPLLGIAWATYKTDRFTWPHRSVILLLTIVFSLIGASVAECNRLTTGHASGFYEGHLFIAIIAWMAWGSLQMWFKAPVRNLACCQCTFWGRLCLALRSLLL